jgi:hypothetical protein
MASEIMLPLMVNDVAATAGDKFWLGGHGIFIAEATWGGGSAKLQYKSPNGTFVDVPATVVGTPSLTANGMCMFELPPGELKVVVATATAVYAYAIGTRVD